MDVNNIEPKTEPLSEREWSRFFGIGRRKIASVLRHTEGAEEIGGRWQLPISKAPVTYWLSRGLLQPRVIDTNHIGADWRIASGCTSQNQHHG